MKKFLFVSLPFIIISILLIHSGCSALHPAQIVPVFDPEATVLPQTGTVVYVKNGITAMAVPLNDVKEVDAFGILIYNGTDHWISFKQKDCWILDQFGNETKPIHKSLLTAYLGKNFKPRLPPEFRADVFRWNKSIRVVGDPAPLPREDIEKTTVMPKQREQFFVYFHKGSLKSSNLRLIIPEVYSEYTDTETTFVFKFQVQKG